MNPIKSLKSLCLLTGLILFPGAALADITCGYSHDAQDIWNDSKYPQINELFRAYTNTCLKFESERDGNECLGDLYVLRDDPRHDDTYKGKVVEIGVREHYRVVWTSDAHESRWVACTFNP